VAEKPSYFDDVKNDVTVGSDTTVNLTLSELQSKVIGRRSDVGIGVLGQTTAGSGTPIALKGEVDSADGYGLYSPDDVLIGGTVDTDGTDFVLETGPTTTGDAANVVLGHASNTAASCVVGRVIGGVGDESEQNLVQDDYSTIGGGKENIASGYVSTVGGGRDNKAYTRGDTIGGGVNNRTGTSETGNLIYATVPGGLGNVAEGKYSFAAGSQAKALHTGAFVWSDSRVGGVESTGADQFVVYAGGGTGIGTNSPVTTLHVKDNVAETGGDNLGRHVAAIENTNSNTGTGNIPDVLGLELSNVSSPGQFHSYISFMDDSGTIGNIQGDGNGGVEFVGSLADFAEFFAKADPDETFADGQVVGLEDGEVVTDVADADTALVVSTAPLVTGNRPHGEYADEDDEYVKLSLVGQVPVQVSGSVECGDVLVAGPDDDGTAVAREACERESPAVVGQALASHDGEEDGEVLALVGGPGLEAIPARQGADRADTDELERENDQLRELLEQRDDRIEALEAENDRLRKRLAAVEDHLGLDTAADPAPADD
jgi:hypothetical protein